MGFKPAAPGSQTFNCCVVLPFQDGGLLKGWGVPRVGAPEVLRACVSCLSFQHVGSWRPGDALRHREDSVALGPDHGVPAGKGPLGSVAGGGGGQGARQGLSWLSLAGAPAGGDQTHLLLEDGARD